MKGLYTHRLHHKYMSFYVFLATLAFPVIIKWAVNSVEVMWLHIHPKIIFDL